MKLVGPVIDHIEPIREQCRVRDLFRDQIKILFVTKTEIKAEDTSRIVGFFEMLSQTLESALAHQGQIILSIDGYDHCKKELWEFAEVRTWMKKFEREVNSAFWFLSNQPPFNSLLVLMFCVCDTKIQYRDHEVKRCLTVTPVARKLRFITRNFEKMNAFTARMGISREDNRRVSVDVGDCISKTEQDAEALLDKLGGIPTGSN